MALSLGGYYYQRIYTEWTEDRAGGSVGLGYQFTHDLTGSVNFQGQNVYVRTRHSRCRTWKRCWGTASFTHSGFAAARHSRQSLLSHRGTPALGQFEETVGTYQYPRASMELSQYFRIFQRADRSGKHVLSLTLKAGYSGDDTPIFERYYAGGFSTIRGFAFRGVTPRDPVYGMGVGGDFQMLASAQYLFPITADDMLRGVCFVNAGTVEPTITNWVDQVRVAPASGCGSRSR